MGYFGAAVLDERDFGGGEVAGVREEGLWRQQAVVVVDSGVRGVSGEAGFHEGELGFGFCEMGLDGEVGFFVEGGERGEQVGGAGGRETGCQDRREEVVKGINGIDILDTRLRILDRRLRRDIFVVVLVNT